MAFTGKRPEIEGATHGAATDEPVSRAVEDFEGAPRPGDVLEIGCEGTRYELVRSLGKGGYAEVFLANQFNSAGLANSVALKCILPGLDASESARREFLYEARLSNRLRHPNIAAALDLAVSRERYYLVLEYVDGFTVRSVMKAARAAERTLSVGFCLHVAASVAEALHYAHTLADEEGKPLGIVHRDVTAANVMVSRSGEVKLLDFGVAYARLEGRERTRTGQFRGTCVYASPEQANGEVLDGRSDLFSLGLVLVELLTGVRVFEEDSGVDSLRRVVECNPREVKVATSGLPPALAKICARALARDPDERFQDGMSFSNALRKYLASAGIICGQADCAAELTSFGGGEIEITDKLEHVRDIPPRAPAAVNARPARHRRRRALVARGMVATGALGLCLVGSWLIESSRGSTVPLPHAAVVRAAQSTAASLAGDFPGASIPTSAGEASSTVPVITAALTDTAVDLGPVVRPRHAAGSARAPARLQAPSTVSQRGSAQARTSFADFADRTTVASERATLPRGTLVAAKLLSAIPGRGADRAEAIVTEEVVADGAVLVPKGATLSCATRPPSDGRVPLACDTISTRERMLAFTGVAVGEGEHLGLRLRDDEVAAGTPFVVYVSAPAALH